MSSVNLTLQSLPILPPPTLSLSTQVIAVFTNPDFGNIQVVHGDENTPKASTGDLLEAIKNALMKDGEDWHLAPTPAPTPAAAPASTTTTTSSSLSSSSSSSAPPPAPAPAGTNLTKQPIVDSPTPYEKNGPGSQSRFDLSPALTTSITSIIFPAYIVIREGRLYNTLAKGFVTFHRVPPVTAADHLNLNDIPKDIAALVDRKQKDWTKVFASIGHGMKPFFTSDAQYSAAVSHNDHVLQPTGNKSAIQRLGDLLSADGVKLFKAAGKGQQLPWREMVLKETLQCAHGDKCKLKSPTINTKETGTWSIDLEKSRNDIVTALQELRGDKKLHLVSGWRVS